MQRTLKERRQDRLDSMISEINCLMHFLTPEQRVEFFNMIAEVYCPFCGDKKQNIGATRICYCQNDD